MIFSKAQGIKWTTYTIGIVIMSFGLSLTIWTKVMGVNPWDSLHLGLTNYIPLNYGQISQLVGVGAILIGMLLGVKPKMGTVINAVLVGWIVNAFLNLFPSGIVNEFKPVTVIIFFVGVALSGIGTGMYITADAGIGPRDSIMVGLNKKFGIKIGWARTILEISVVSLGFILSGPIGVGTIIFSLTVGFFIAKTLKTFKKWQVIGPELEKVKNR